MARYGYKHGMWNTRIYHIWRGMKQRCEDKNAPAYRNYGAKGITVCREWHDFINFYEWARSNGYQDDLTIDRINNSKGYSPENCRWADLKTQGRNQTTNRIIEYNGETHCLTEWAEITGISRRAIWGRLAKGWTVQDALTVHTKARQKNLRNERIIAEYDGKSMDLKSWSEITGIPSRLLRERISARGWAVERALTTPVQVKGNRTEKGGDYHSSRT